MSLLMKRLSPPTVLLPSSFSVTETRSNGTGGDAVAAFQLGGGGCFKIYDSSVSPVVSPGIGSWPIPAPSDSYALYQGRWATGQQFSSGAAGRDLRPWFEMKVHLVSGTLNQYFSSFDTWIDFADPSGSFGNTIGNSRAQFSGVGSTVGVVELEIRRKGTTGPLLTSTITFTSTRT